jgi:glutathione S-transferase
MADDIILHHYDTSPFSEKVRILLGIKGLAWRSVIQPTIMPKPDLVPLTGGYRRIPVMQIGADVFCDSQVILAEIERRSPSPKVIHGTDWAINLWADRIAFQPAVAVIFGAIGDSVPAEFIKDREALSGAPFDVAAMKATSGPMKEQVRAMAAWLERQLAEGGDWLGGASPSLADIAGYMNFWFLGGALREEMEALLAGMPNLARWRERVRAIGHGQRTDSTTEAAIAVAKAAEPAAVPHVAHDPHEPSGIAPGEKVVIGAADYGRDPIAGTLVAANPERLVILREDPRVGRAHLHTPRAGFYIARA